MSLLQLRLIGDVVVSWARLEAGLQDVIWQLLEMDLADGRVITGRLDVRPKIELLRVFGSRYLTDPALLAELLEVTEVIEHCQTDRNFILHGSWVTCMTMHWVPAAMSLREKGPPDGVVLETFPEPGMRQIIADIQMSTQRLARISNLLFPFPDTPPWRGLPETASPPASPTAYSPPKRLPRLRPSRKAKNNK